MYECSRVRSAELVRLVQRLARKRGVAFKHESRKGKGSHSRLWYGTRFTTVPMHAHDLKTGTLHAILKQLALTLEDLRE